MGDIIIREVDIAEVEVLDREEEDHLITIMIIIKIIRIKININHLLRIKIIINKTTMDSKHNNNNQIMQTMQIKIMLIFPSLYNKQLYILVFLSERITFFFVSFFSFLFIYTSIDDRVSFLFFGFFLFLEYIWFDDL